MILFIVLVTTEILNLVVIREHFFDKSWMRYYLFMILNATLSIWLWILWFETVTYEGIFDEPAHVWILMNLAGMICAVVFPRIILSIFHFSGKYARRRTGGHSRPLTNTGIIISAFIFIVIATGTLYGRFNFKTENYTVKVKGLPEDLEGLRIVQISDLHLASYYHHKEVIMKAVRMVNELKPDLLINTGDFITFGWREFGRFDTILRIPDAKYGKFAIMGNHDFGTYQPFFTEADLRNNVLIMHNQIRSSGYTLLNDEFATLKIKDATIAIAGVNTRGSFPHIIYGDLDKAIDGISDADYKILLTHDPNHWGKAVLGKTDIDLTLSGHTHGMQIGIITRKFKWSPAKFFYPRWNGLYRENEQQLVVNRGLGVLAVPFRIWMPPEISVITLSKE